MAEERTITGNSPGPWDVSLTFPTGVIYGPDQRAIAVIAMESGAAPLREANAHLIAAAPDLLALAKAYEAWEADLVISGDWSGETVRMTQAQHDRLIEIQTMRNAALAKAKGVAS